MIISVSDIAVVYIRYRQVAEYYSWKYANDSSVVNKVALCMGITSVIGSSIVANFQEDNLRIVHLLGVLFAFVGGNIWILFQVCISLFHSLVNS
jgi:hypothetical protein